ncbi:inorganic pyrophosphatase [Prolixibacter bellariivorans]|uniref:inorganic diphosphatase n=1 Tax=Prolixibacter bellariivorans TaxID=314319 RepID=A0A5M4AXS5_9BACT|nr:inorganic pyrophosphatase [Prolixibacter bellariivorans]GET32423.1 inorganic pyrophosphatase [Prolixibacter bellariivorans]
MADKFSDPIGRLMGLRYKSHPWHGVHIGSEAPEKVTAYIEVVPTDTVKYEVDKDTGYLKIDRPQRYSNVVPALYGFIPQTYCGKQVGDYCSEKTGRPGIKGDGDPIDIVVLTEKAIHHGDILVSARPIGGFRMIDKNEADDKIIAVLDNDFVYSHFTSLKDVPENIIIRLKHYFLTYKDIPDEVRNSEITHIYEHDEAIEVIKRSIADYSQRFENLGKLLSLDD